MINVDVCVVLGGDGTMLRATQMSPPGLLLVGVNTDPVRSIGQLCSVAVSNGEAGMATASSLARKLWAGDYELVLSRPPAAGPRERARAVAPSDVAPPAPQVRTPRLRASVEGSAGWGRVVRGLNEAFIGESDPCACPQRLPSPHAATRAVTRC